MWSLKNARKGKWVTRKWKKKPAVHTCYKTEVHESIREIWILLVFYKYMLLQNLHIMLLLQNFTPYVCFCLVNTNSIEKGYLNIYLCIFKYYEHLTVSISDKLTTWRFFPLPTFLMKVWSIFCKNHTKKKSSLQFKKRNRPPATKSESRFQNLKAHSLLCSQCTS